MALAMCSVIIEDGLYDRDFVARYCEGFDGFRDHLRDHGYTPGVGRAAICGIDAKTIRRLAHEFATTKPAMSAIFKGSGYYTNGADAARACYILNALCGEVDKPGNLNLKDWAPLAAPGEHPGRGEGEARQAAAAHRHGLSAGARPAQLAPARGRDRRQAVSDQGACSCSRPTR